MNNIVYPQKAININLENIIEVPVKFTSKGAEIPLQGFISGERLKQIVVVAYANEETHKHVPANPNSESVKILQDEVWRVVQSLKNFPKELEGKTFIISVKFIIEDEVVVTGYGNPPKKGIAIRQGYNPNETANSDSKDPVFILNDEKIISKEEMEKIEPGTIQSIEVIKTGKYNHKQLGEINGKVVIITLKK